MKNFSNTINMRLVTMSLILSNFHMRTTNHLGGICSSSSVTVIERVLGSLLVAVKMKKKLLKRSIKLGYVVQKTHFMSRFSFQHLTKKLSDLGNEQGR